MTPKINRRRVRRTGPNAFEVKLPADDRLLIRSLAPQMRELLGENDPDAATAQLFPVAYPTDVDRQTEYRLLVHDELRSSHLEALEALEASSEAEILDEDQILGWMRAVNQVRLVLGTRLDVSEEGVERPKSADDPSATAFAIYDYLTWLQDAIVIALSSAVPD